MAGFQAVGITHSSYPASQQTSHHYHSHHHHLHHHPHQHQQSHRSPPSSMECLASPSSCASASSLSASGQAPPSSAKARSFSAVGGAPSEDCHQPMAELASSSARRRYSEDSSNRLRSEWVTLSKAMLMVLVEKICQLSFENDAQTSTPMSGVEPGTQRPLASNDATCQRNSVASDETGGSATPSKAGCSQAVISSAVSLGVTLSAVDATPNVAEPFAHSPAVAHLFPPPAPALSPAPRDSPDTHVVDDSVPTADATAAAAAAIDASIETDAENTWTSVAEAADGSGATTPPPKDAVTEPSASWTSATGSLNRKRGARRTHAKPARGGGGCRGRGAAGKREDAGVLERTEDKMRGIKMRPLRQRNCDRSTVQPWVACNKSLVYSMIDSALGAVEPAAPAVTRQVVVTSPVALETGVRSSGVKGRAAVGAKDVDDVRGSGAVNPPRDHAEPPRRPTTGGSPDATCDAPLLGALLSYDDVGVTNNPRDIPVLPTPPPPPPLRRQHHLPRGSSPVKAIRRIVGPNWHRTFSEELRIPSPLYRNLAYGCSSAQMVVDHPFVASPIFSAQVRNAEDLTPGRSANKNILLRSGTGFSEKSSRFAHQIESASNSLRNSDRLSSELDPPRTNSRRMETRAKTTVGPNVVERPRWIALDKDEVHSLVDSLVLTMMTSDDDFTRLSAARCRSLASPGNAVCNNGDYRSLSDNDAGHHDNDETGCKRLTVVTGDDSGRHDNGEDNQRLVATDSGRYDDDEATIEYDRFVAMDFGRHDDGKRGGCWRSRAMQCLSKDGSGDYPVGEPGSVARDNGAECSSVARAVSEGLARNMMKWKKSMLLRLHSQSQDEEK